MADCLQSSATGGKTHFCLTDAIGGVIGPVDVDNNKVDSYACGADILTYGQRVKNGLCGGR
ncbi:hypothetical protein ACH4F6_05370 [Streptomyces sp. NPDC017936]|uniref:hypothetical protein n=1 Tax=Streptomyces sp. NPDC017936 TaxID=3365016 RepID=UPI00379092C8